MKGTGVICFLIGGAIGAGATYIVLNKKYNERFENEVGELRDTYKRELKALREERAKLKGEPCENHSEDCKDCTDEKPVDILKAADRSEKDLCKYSSITREYVSENEEKPKYTPDDHPEDIDEELPYVITMEDFLEDPNYKKETVGYFVDEDLFVDDMDRLIDGMQGMDLGMGNLDQWNDHSIVYIRKPSNMTDYEVMREVGSYYETLDDEPMFSVGGDGD